MCVCKTWICLLNLHPCKSKISSKRHSTCSPLRRNWQCACVMTVYFLNMYSVFFCWQEYSSCNMLTLARARDKNRCWKGEIFYTLVVVGIELFYLYLAWIKFRHWNINSINLYTQAIDRAIVQFTDCISKEKKKKNKCAFVLCLLLFFLSLSRIFWPSRRERIHRKFLMLSSSWYYFMLEKYNDFIYIKCSFENPNNETNSCRKFATWMKVYFIYVVLLFFLFRLFPMVRRKCWYFEATNTHTRSQVDGKKYVRLHCYKLATPF